MIIQNFGNPSGNTKIEDLDTEFILPVTKGGTGASTIEQALINLGITTYITEQINMAIGAAIEASY